MKKRILTVYILMIKATIFAGLFPFGYAEVHLLKRNILFLLFQDNTGN